MGSAQSYAPARTRSERPSTTTRASSARPARPVRSPDPLVPGRPRSRHRRDHQHHRPRHRPRPAPQNAPSPEQANGSSTYPTGPSQYSAPDTPPGSASTTQSSPTSSAASATHPTSADPSAPPSPRRQHRPPRPRPHPPSPPPPTKMTRSQVAETLTWPQTRTGSAGVRVHGAADAFLQQMRFGRGCAESTTKVYARSTAAYLLWCCQVHRDWRVGSTGWGAFMLSLRHAPGPGATT